MGVSTYKDSMKGTGPPIEPNYLTINSLPAPTIFLQKCDEMPNFDD